jgi:hypothetical protein
MAEGGRASESKVSYSLFIRVFKLLFEGEALKA